MVSAIVGRIWRCNRTGCTLGGGSFTSSTRGLLARYSFHLLADPGGSVIGEGVGCGARETCGIALLVLTRSAVPP
jgi:hypothetical protein